VAVTSAQTASRAVLFAVFGNVIAVVLQVPALWFYLNDATTRSALLTGFAFSGQIWAALILWIISRLVRDRWALRA
jgi:hypothetical protein